MEYSIQISIYSLPLVLLLDERKMNFLMLNSGSFSLKQIIEVLQNYTYIRGLITTKYIIKYNLECKK